MFGYVRIYKPELKVAEYEHYQGIYCSLCKQLGRRYGFFARMTLSYDSAFLALFRIATDEQCSGFRNGRCLYHPMKKRLCCGENEHISFAADMETLLIYYKLKDNIADRGFFASLPARILLPLALLSKKRAAKRQPELDKILAECIAEQSAVETLQSASIDAASEPFARMLSRLARMTAHTDTEGMVLQRFGYCLGRWIYLIDAVDDMKEDLEQGSYNPYILSRGLRLDDEASFEETRQYSLLTLNACLAECIAAYNLLTIHRFDGILRNVLERGMPAMQRQVIAKKGSRHERKRSVSGVGDQPQRDR